ncbi:ABC transporter ATP-binding protein [Bdellovibrio sp. SKB1291214]|uniref:ABC transporter ATP-binding protein n=1 Tax=Bdellovibrio sp. SKB1291214 TaxID=1732569 RepID=UPI000B51949D|nr:ABC transporter ATP-binding protein [Bdellovibrio sp. SKB1291214]UYL09215.1 ABC transporter ATP-binding protein [Bdellovibrio sp. SKB1291214]
MNNPPSHFLSVRNIHKSYPSGNGELEILRGVNMDINGGEALAILGSSGAGKSTLLQIMGTLDRPTQGEVFFEGRDLLALNDEELSKFRNAEMGFVFQFHHLLSEFNAVENVMIPCRVAGESPRLAKEKALHLLEFMGLADRADHYPSQLSGGELQRVAIARALVRHPKILFADEPTGNLDSNTSAKIQELFFRLKEEMKLALVIVTHDLTFATRFPKVYRMKDGLWV